MKTVICAGDSFTFHCTEENMAWPYHLDKALFDVHVCAEMGSSNTMIARNALYELSKQQGKDVVLIVGWSEHTRFELHYDKSHPLFNDVKRVEKTHDHKVTNYLCNKNTEDSAWLKSTGGYGHWKFNNENIDRVITNYFTEHHSDVNQYINSMHSIIMLQDFCRVRNIPILNFKAWDHDILSGKYTEAYHLEQMVDRSLWWIYNRHQGLREWCRDLGDEIPEGMHPHAKFQKMFSEQVITEFLKGL